jgi:hypothetical protein
MNNPIVPLVVRLTVLTFSALALGLSGSIFQKAGRTNCSRGSSTWLAVIVDVVAIIYTVYITWDEYTSKPLGLRSHRAKMRLIFLDLIFVVFDSANLSLAFEALTDDQWACRDAQSISSGVCELNHDICVRQKALTATLLIALLAWLVTFGISTLRFVRPASSHIRDITNISQGCGEGDQPVREVECCPINLEYQCGVLLGIGGVWGMATLEPPHESMCTKYQLEGPKYHGSANASFFCFLFFLAGPYNYGYIVLIISKLARSFTGKGLVRT